MYARAVCVCVLGLCGREDLVVEDEHHPTYFLFQSIPSSLSPLLGSVTVIGAEEWSNVKIER